MNEYKLYCLRHPETLELRYIGVTKYSLEKRLTNHLCDKKKTYKTNWIKSLKNQGLTPIIELIESFETKQEMFKAEIRSIKRCKILGYRLVNIGIGGEGGNFPNRLGFKHSDETKEIIRQKSKGNKNSLGRKLSDKTRDKLRKVNEYKNKKVVDSLGNIFNSVAECRRFHNVDKSTMNRVLRKLIHTYKGISFYYYEEHNEY